MSADLFQAANLFQQQKQTNFCCPHFIYYENFKNFIIKKNLL
jgi:hypothetical protein